MGIGFGNGRQGVAIVLDIRRLSKRVGEWKGNGKKIGQKGACLMFGSKSNLPERMA